MPNKHHTKPAQPADQAAVNANSTSAPAIGDQVPNSAKAGSTSPSDHGPQRVVLSSRELKKLHNYTYRRLRNEVGVGLFLEILELAAFAMLDDIEGHNGQPGTITRDQLFDAEGIPTLIAQRYIEGVFDATVSDNFIITCDLERALISAFDEKMLCYFEAVWADQKRQRAKQDAARQRGSAKVKGSSASSFTSLSA